MRPFGLPQTNGIRPPSSDPSFDLDASNTSNGIPIAGLWICIEVKGRIRGETVRLTTNEWYKATQLGDTYWLYVVWDPLSNPHPVPLMVQNPAKHLDHAKKEIVAARYYDLPAQAIEAVAKAQADKSR